MVNSARNRSFATPPHFFKKIFAISLIFHWYFIDISLILRDILVVFCTTIVEILDFSKTSLTSRDCNFTKIWSLRISKYTRHIYSSRSLHFWCLIHATPSSIPSKPTKRTHENRNFRFWRCGAQPLSELR